MEPQLIDYYNDLPYGIHVIDKMNEELEVLQDKYRKLQGEYDYYKKPSVLYDSQEEWKHTCQSVDQMLDSEITKCIIDYKGYQKVYSIWQVPDLIRTICEKALNQLTKNEDLKDLSINKWSLNTSHEMKNNLDAFIQGMKSVPCPTICNEHNLRTILYSNIRYQFGFQNHHFPCIIDNIPYFRN